MHGLSLRAALGAVVAGGLLAAAVMVYLPTAGSAASAAAPPGTEAAATLPEVKMVCESGQVDVNHAEVAALGATLGISRPVAERVVAARPYLAPRDLAIIAGIGPSKTDAIVAAGRACATPTTSPPPAQEACTDDRPDIQSASVAELVRGLGLSRPVAERLVEARPFASIRHVVPERVPGLGRGRNEALRAAACLTPAPVRTRTASFRWAYASQRTRVVRDLAVLEIAPGKLDVTGAWLSITDATSSTSMEGPTADFHIWGPWEGGQDTVKVTMPLDPDHVTVTGSDLVPALVHDVTGDLELFGGPSTTVTSSTVSAELTSLSRVTSFLLPTRYFTAPPTTMSSVVMELVRGLTGTRADQPDCQGIAAADRVETGGRAIQTDLALGRAPMKWCVGRRGDNASWTFANDTGTVLSINAQHAAYVVDTGLSGDALTDFTFEQFNGTSGPRDQTRRARVDVPPGSSVTLEAPPGTVDDEVLVASNELLAATALSTRIIGTFIPDDEVSLLWSVLNNCGFAPSTTGRSFFTVLNCVKDSLDAYSLDTSLRTKVKKAVEFFLTAANGAITFVDALAVELGDPYDIRLTWYSLPSPTPPTQGHDGAIDGGSGGSGGQEGRMILKRASSIETFVLGQDGIARPIPDGGTYLCNAYVMPVRYGVDAAEFNAAAPGGIGAPATCPSGNTRSLSPASTRNHILRLESGEAWLVDTTGTRTRILNGNVGFDCFAERFLVWDYVTRDEIHRFPIAPGDVGTFCGS